MKFKLNPIEKFIIRHKFLSKLFFLVIYFVLVIIAIFGELPDCFVTICAIVFVFIGLFINSYSAFKAYRLLKIHDEYLDMLAFLDGTNQMIMSLNPKDIPNISTFCNNRITALYNIGDYERAEAEIRLFWQSLDLKKVPAINLVNSHISMAMIALTRLDKTTYNEQMKIVYQYRQNLQNNALVRNIIDYSIKNSTFFANAKFAMPNTEIANFEEEVLAHLNTSPKSNKPRKKSPSKLEVFSAHCKLFVYYKNIGNDLKATYYAQKLIEFGNEQLAAYHKAKEYLENENRSN